MWTSTTIMEKSMDVFKLNIDLPYDTAILILGIYPEKTLIQKDVCTSNVHCSTIYNSQDMEAT